MWMSIQLKVMPNFGAAIEKKTNIISSGVLRTRVT